MKWIESKKQMPKTEGVYFAKSTEGVKHTTEFTGVHLMSRAGYHPDFWLDESVEQTGEAEQDKLWNEIGEILKEKWTLDSFKKELKQKYIIRKTNHP